MKKLTIKDWAEDDRPREKVLLRGITSLSNAELLAILIGSGNNDESAIQLSQRILNTVNNNLYALGKLSLSDLTTGFKGIGVAKGVTILAALELGRDVGKPNLPFVYRLLVVGMSMIYSFLYWPIYPMKSFGLLI